MNTSSAPIYSVRHVAGPAEVAAATRNYTHHELRRKKYATVTESYLTPNIHYMYTAAHCSITQHRYTRSNSPSSYAASSALRTLGVSARLDLLTPPCPPASCSTHAPTVAPLSVLFYEVNCFSCCCLVSAVFLKLSFLFFPKGRASLS